jgi:CubicO group peptidase (beta-lactamase class C family)
MAHVEVAILNDKLIHRATRDLMWTPLKPSDGSEDNYGLGFGSFTEDGIHLVGHSGGQQGTSTDFLLAPERLAGVVVLANMEGASANELCKQILRIVLGKPSDEKKK